MGSLEQTMVKQMNFKQYLTELFDKPVQYTIRRHDPDTSRFAFNIDGEDYICNIENIHFSTSDDDPKNWDISFHKRMGGAAIFDATNDVKNRFKVFATIIKITRDFFKKNPLQKGDTITFDADKDSNGKHSRVAIYNKFAKQLAKEMGLTLYTSPNHSLVVFKLVKK